jgi:hypothetical protein
MDLIQSADPESRTAVLRKALAFEGLEAEDQSFRGAYALIIERRKDSTEAAPPDCSVSLSSGITVQLLGITEKKWSEYLTWWYPNGVRGGALPDALKNLNHSAYAILNPTPQEIVYTFALRLNDQAVEKLDWDFELTAGTTILNSKSKYTRAGTDYTVEPVKVISACLPKESKACSLRVGVANGPWETVAVYDNEKKAFTQSTEPSLAVKQIGYADNWSSTFVQYDHQIKDRAFQVVAITKTGQTLSRGGYGTGLGNSPFPFFRFKGKPEAIARFEFQTRPYQWVDVQNISLIPDKKTDTLIEKTKEEGR